MERTINFKGKEIPIGEVFYWNTTDQFFRGTLGNGVSRTVKTDDSLAVIECVDTMEQVLINGLQDGDICPTIVAGYYKQGAGKLLNYVGTQFAPGVLEIEDMKEQEIMNGTADGLCPTLKAGYFKMGAANFLGHKKGEDGMSAPCVIETDMTEQKLINELKDGTCPAVLASYNKKGGADLTREKYGHPFVMDVVNGDADGNARTIVAQYGTKGKSSIARNDGLGMTGVIEKDPAIAASRGRGEGWQQTLEFNKDGKSNTITSVPKDNLVVNGIPKGKLRVENGCLIDENGYRYRIRKLTPRECFRLQDVSDKDIDTIQAYRCEESGIILNALGNPVLNIEFQGPKKNEKKVMVKVNGEWKDFYQSELLYTKEGSGISRSAQYKLAGNSICVAPMYHTFRKLFIETENENQQLELF